MNVYLLILEIVWNFNCFQWIHVTNLCIRIFKCLIKNDIRFWIEHEIELNYWTTWSLKTNSQVYWRNRKVFRSNIYNTHWKIFSSVEKKCCMLYTYVSDSFHSCLLALCIFWHYQVKWAFPNWLKSFCIFLPMNKQIKYCIVNKWQKTAEF